LSDDIAFRFAERSWREWPLTVDKYADWVAASGGDSAHVFIDYETLGEPPVGGDGDFDFVRFLPEAFARRGIQTVHPSTLASRTPVGGLSYPRRRPGPSRARRQCMAGETVCRRRHTGAFYRLAPAVRACRDTGCSRVRHDSTHRSVGSRIIRLRGR